MYQEISQLLMYGDLDEDSILAQMGEVFGKYETGEYNKTGLVRDINTQVKRICLTMISDQSKKIWESTVSARFPIIRPSIKRI